MHCDKTLKTDDFELLSLDYLKLIFTTIRLTNDSWKLQKV